MFVSWTSPLNITEELMVKSWDIFALGVFVVRKLHQAGRY